jgi:hypothetical protein
MAFALVALDAFGIGLVLVLVGCFLLANSLLFHDPRALLREHFGAPRARLASIRGYIFHRLQVQLAFLLLLMGFALELYGHYAVAPAGRDAPAREFPLVWVGAIVLAVVALEAGGWWLSHALFLRHLRKHFRAHPPELENDLALARELGALLGIHSSGDDSVQSYLARIRRRIGLSVPARAEVRATAAQALAEEGGPEEGFV